MDRCLSIQSGKAWMVPEDQTVRNATVWCQSSKYQGPCDNYLASHASLLCIMSRFVGTVNPAAETNSGQPNKDLDFVEIQKIYDEELLAWKSRTDVRHKDDKSSGDPARVMQITLIYCVFNYCRLVIFSYGLQQMTKRNKLKEDTIYFTGCIQAASSLVKLMVEDFMPTGFVKYFPELVYVHAAFGAVVLLKCLRPEFRQMMDEQQEERIVDIIKGLFDAWTSDDFSKDERHNTQIYARFLKQLLDPHIARIEKRRMGASAVDASLNSSSTSEFTPSPISDDTPSFQFPDAAPFDVDMKALPQSMEGMVSDAGGSWEELYSQALNSGYLGGAAGGGSFLAWEMTTWLR
ncbi:hypothetical protein A0H81_05571 [Grifola frondosa]|uniref:Uncharacterized protein n=1 Tax=Grifola frondosa TaxID=5627 RepID=A0A1C7MBH5_GRIFR|nr:hypothetical protein A0H81_05571 [Grifola frondosa]